MNLPNGPQLLFFLKEDVYFEPLVHNWYVWPYLLPPVTAAMNLTGRNLRLMKSFVANSHLHLAASRTAGLAGGDFVNCTQEQVEEVRALIEDLEVQHCDYFAIREAVTELNALLERQSGLSMEGLYNQVPAMLRGYVELVYDMNHHASFRLIEGLLYSGSLYKRSAQSIRLGSLSAVKTRPFVLSSPRLPDSNHLHLAVALEDRRLDTLFAMRTTPASWPVIDKLFAGVERKGGLSLDSLFTEIAPRRVHQRITSGVRVSFLGHAGLMIETPRIAILVDPVIAYRDGVHDDDIISFSELPHFIDYICITHTHMDHTCIETLLQLRGRVGRVLVPKNGGGDIADPSIKLMLQALGFSVLEFEDMERLPCADGHITAIPFLGEHADLRIRSKTAWHFELQGRKILSGADSSSLDDALYRRIHEHIGNLDLLFIGMECVGAPMSWLYGSLFTKAIPRAINESRRFNGANFASARALIEIFEPSEVHVYALGMESWYAYFMGIHYDEQARQIVESDELLRFCAERHITAGRLIARRTWELTASEGKQ